MNPALDGLVSDLQRLHLSHTRMQLDPLLERAGRETPPYLDFLAATLRAEVEARDGKRITMQHKMARFPSRKALEGFDFRFAKSVEKKSITELASGAFVSRGENVLFLGPPGVGKTHLAIAIGRAVIERGHTVEFITAANLVAGLLHANQQDRLQERLALHGKRKLLIVDELGYLPMAHEAASLFFALVAHRYEKVSLMITSNHSVSHWGRIFSDEVLATAILDRLLHHSHVIQIRGESYRLREKRRSGLVPPPAQGVNSNVAQGGQN